MKKKKRLLFSARREIGAVCYSADKVGAWAVRIRSGNLCLLFRPRHRLQGSAAGVQFGFLAPSSQVEGLGSQAGGFGKEGAVKAPGGAGPCCPTWIDMATQFQDRNAFFVCLFFTSLDLFFKSELHLHLK